LIRDRATSFALENCLLETLPAPLLLPQWSTLTSLSLESNYLSHLGNNFASQFLNLAELNLAHNSFSVLPLELSRLVRLTKLNVADNSIRIIQPEVLETLKSLRELVLDDNPIDILPPRLAEISTLSRLSLRNVVVSNVPAKTVSKGTKAIIDHLRHIIHQETAIWRRFKLCLCGKEGVGKTTLLNVTMTRKKYNRDVSTDGISVHEWNFPKDSFSFRVFDMGGQATFYPTHVSLDGEEEEAEEEENSSFTLLFPSLSAATIYYTTHVLHRSHARRRPRCTQFAILASYYSFCRLTAAASSNCSNVRRLVHRRTAKAVGAVVCEFA
jgi:hypothetical protein